MGESGFQVSAEALAAAAAIEKWPQWLHRRYETISLESVNSILRTVRLDLSVPDELLKVPRARWNLVPLVRVPKAEVPSLRLTDETGGPTTVLTSAENRALTAETLIAQLQASTAAEGFDDLLTAEAVAAIYEVVREDDFVSAGKASLRWSDHARAVMGDARYRFDMKTAKLVEQVSKFVQSELIFAALAHGGETWRVLTLTHPESISRFSRPGLRSEMERRHLAQHIIGELLGWRDTTVSFSVKDGWISETLEVAARVPEGVEVRSLYVHTLGVKYGEVGSARSAEARAPQVLHTRVSEVGKEESAHCLAYIRSDPGYPTAVAGASLFGSVVLTAGALGLDRLNEVTDAAVTLLLAGPTLFASLIALPGRGRLATQTVQGARALLGVTAAATFIAALLLVAVSPGEGQCSAWLVLTVVAWVMTALLSLGVLLRFRQVARFKEETRQLERKKWQDPDSPRMREQ